MTNEELIESLANTVLLTRLELDAVRTVLVGVLAHASRDPSLAADLANRISRAMDGDAAVMLHSPMTDQNLTRRIELMQKLMPPQLWQLVRQQQP